MLSVIGRSFAPFGLLPLVLVALAAPTAMAQKGADGVARTTLDVPDTTPTLDEGEQVPLPPPLILQPAGPAVTPPPIVAAPPDPHTATAVIASMAFTDVAPTTFTMGARDLETGAGKQEKPAHEVRITRSFALARYEVTREQWTAIMGNDPARFADSGAKAPIEQVSWFDAALFANRLSALAGVESCYDLSLCVGVAGFDYNCTGLGFKGLDCKGFRLPTEAEWELAARAGTTTVVWSGDVKPKGERDAPELDAIAWYGGNAGVAYPSGVDCGKWPEVQSRAVRCGPHPVGQKQANPLGFHDLLGNVYEWTHDWFGPYAAEAQIDPLGPREGPGKVVRGGAFDSRAADIRAARRVGFAANGRDHAIGFRLARSR